LQAMDVRESDSVLDIGCSTGYGLLILARLAGSVTGLEQDADLARQASERLTELSVANATVQVGSLDQGWPAGAPYDVILIEGTTEVLPPNLAPQLKPDSGRLVCIHGQGGAGRAMIYRRTAEGLAGMPIFDASGPLVPGFAAMPSFVF